MRFSILVEDIVYEHRLPIPQEPGRYGTDVMDLAGGETIDLSYMRKTDIEAVFREFISAEQWQATSENNLSDFRITFEMKGNPKSPEEAEYSSRKNNRIIVKIDLSREPLNIQSIRILSRDKKDNIISYSSNKHNIILPEWMKNRAKFQAKLTLIDFEK